jgi:hypothetical protein
MFPRANGAAELRREKFAMARHAVVIAGGGPTGLMLGANRRWRASTLPSSSGAPARTLSDPQETSQ